MREFERKDWLGVKVLSMVWDAFTELEVPVEYSDKDVH